MNDNFYVIANEYDNLTKLYRRESILSYMDYLIGSNQSFSFCILDIDNFKTINDNYGHLVGDEVLRVVAKSLKKLAEDRGGVVGRYGGDEFIFLFKDKIEYQEIWQVCFDIIKSTSDLVIKGNNDIVITYTLGVSRFPTDSKDINELITLADKGLYRGKIKGRNCFIIYLPEKHANIKLEANREKVYSPIFLHSKIYTILTKDDNIISNIESAINFIGSYFLIDSLCIETPTEIKFRYLHPLAKNKSIKPYGIQFIDSFVSSNGVFVENCINYKDENNNKLVKEMIKQELYSAVLCKIAAYGKTYGYLRAEVTTLDTGRIWQNEDLIALECIANYIALALYAKKEKL